MARERLGGQADPARISASLDQLKGLIMKMGQVAAFVDPGLAPEWRDALSRLHAQATPMAPEVAASIVTDELGAPPEALFRSWSPVAFAAASIGQVHEATLHDGRKVAVKVQYPDAEANVEQDLQNLEMLGPLMRASSPGLDREAVLGELRARFLEECDYRLEARNQASFHARWREDPELSVPEVIADRSSRRVLTTLFAEGEDLAALKGASAERRSALGQAMFRFAFTSALRDGAFHCDPHPGNFRFEERRVHVLDFGCVRDFTPEFLEGWREMLRAILRDDLGRFRAAAIRLGLVPDPARFDMAYQLRIGALLSRPWLAPQPFTFGPDYIAELREVMLVHNPNLRRMDLPPPMVFLNRLQWGLYAVLAELRASGDWRALMLPLLERGAPASASR